MLCVYIKNVQYTERHKMTLTNPLLPKDNHYSLFFWILWGEKNVFIHLNVLFKSNLLGRVSCIVCFSPNTRSLHMGLVYPGASIPCLACCGTSLLASLLLPLPSAVHSRGILLKGKWDCVYIWTEQKLSLLSPLTSSGPSLMRFSLCSSLPAPHTSQVWSCLRAFTLPVPSTWSAWISFLPLDSLHGCLFLIILVSLQTLLPDHLF